MLLKSSLFAAALVAIDLPAGAWEYTSDKDQMTGKERHFASTPSTNSLDLKFPYAGANHGVLMVRKQARAEVLFMIGKGQIMCHLSACDIAVKFGDKPPVIFGGSHPSDNSSNMVFLDNADRFVAEAMKVKTILVQANIYQNGAPILRFDNPAPLDWPSK